MKGRRIASLIPHPSALLAAFLFAAASVAALEIPPPPKFFYNDAAALLNSEQGRALNEKLAAFEQRSGVQFIIYVFPTLDDEALEDFTIRCAERWKAGNKKYDNGLILFVFVKERKLRIEVGYGLEPTITDAFSSRVIREYLTPHFRQGDYAGGLNAATDALIAQIEKKEAPVAPAQARRQTGAIDIFGLIVLLVIFLFVILPLIRRGGCGGCFWPMFFMGGGGGRTFGGGGWSGGGGGGWSGFSGGGGSFGGGGASGGW